MRIDASAGPDENSVWVDEIHPAVGLERSIYSGYVTAADAVQHCRSTAGLNEPSNGVLRYIELLPVDDGPVRGGDGSVIAVVVDCGRPGNDAVLLR